MRREIIVIAGTNRIVINDTVENCGYETEPLMQLYHINFGFPLLGPDTRLISSDCAEVRPRDETAAAGLTECRVFQGPTHGYAEQVFSYDLLPEKDGSVFAGLCNPNLNISACVRFQKNELPYLIQWKQMGEGDYTCGIEPGTWLTEGRAKARERGELLFIKPGEQKRFSLEISIG